MRANADLYASTRGALYAASVEANNLSRTKKILAWSSYCWPNCVCVNADAVVFWTTWVLSARHKSCNMPNAGNLAHQSQPLFEW